MGVNKQIGRFEILRELGRGAQSIVYLALDPHLQRRVAIKTLHFSRADEQQNRQLLAEARMVSQLRHPNIVPIYEAGEEQGDLYLVFEFVPGRNLAEHLQKQGALSTDKALALMLPILDAIAHAHAAGIIHRDLKPSNILIDEQGVPRVMDFGIAARATDAAADGGQWAGTPAYMAPEYISQRVSDVQSDVFSAGLVLYELLSGQRAVTGRDAHQVMKTLSTVDIRLPTVLTETLDDKFKHLLYRALARQPADRFASAAQMREAIDDYLQPEPAAAGNADAQQSTIEFLLRRMRLKSDFPALSESVGAVNRITAGDMQSISDVANTILKDYSLTNKLLRVVNSVHYRHVGGGDISTVSRAVVVLGLDAVRSIAITVMLFDHLQNKTIASQLKEEFLRAHLAGTLARELAGKSVGRGDAEQAFICAMFHHLGRLLSQYYFPEESTEIRRLVSQKNLAEDQAAVQILGVSYQDLGIAIAQSWGFPHSIVNSMRQLPDGKVRRPVNDEERLRVVAALANDICSQIGDRAIGAEQWRQITARYGEAIPHDEAELREALAKVLDQVGDFARSLHVDLRQTTFGRPAQTATGGSLIADRQEKPQKRRNAPLSASDDALAGTLILDCPVQERALFADSPDEESVDNAGAHGEVVLLAGIQDVSNALVSDFKLN
ncbi:MAG TPA: protein kinase, partial [Accumulibacter sp.]|nr:protein kinase [Accumulibacter sp.]